MPTISLPAESSRPIDSWLPAVAIWIRSSDASVLVAMSPASRSEVAISSTAAATVVLWSSISADAVLTASTLTWTDLATSIRSASAVSARWASAACRAAS